ncbi:MAG: signal recognition particle-docking protein FtsY [Polyangiales bacterium]
MTPIAWLVLALVAVAAIALLLWNRGQARLPPGEEPEKLPPSTKGATPAEAKPSEKKPAEAKPSERPSEKASERPTERKPSERPQEAKPSEKSSEKPAEKPAEAKATTEPAASPAAEAERPSEPAAPLKFSQAPSPIEATFDKPIEKAPEKPRDVSALKKGLAQTRTGWMARLLSVFAGKKEIDPALLDEIEETLLTGDVGAPTTKRFVDGLKERLGRKELGDADKVWEALKADALSFLDLGAPPFAGRATSKPLVILMVGVNGAGKTTTIAKLATRYKEQGKTVLLAAGDTFRAAAVAQLEMWGKRVGVPVHKGREGAKPGAVVYEAVARGVSEGVDVIIADTAGRLQTKAPLMEELRKIREACGKASPGAPHEVLLVLDATTGQNAISQAREFRETLELTGVVLTKLDGTARGGVILAIADEFKLPVRFVGVGEKSDDLREFDPRDFVDALFARDGDEETHA